jgi:hypothetical protein
VVSSSRNVRDGNGRGKGYRSLQDKLLKNGALSCLGPYSYVHNHTHIHMIIQLIMPTQQILVSRLIHLTVVS